MAGSSIITPPIKCQGIKTKLVPFIIENVRRDENGLWIEPFVGTGAVAFNIAPKRALLSDKTSTSSLSIGTSRMVSSHSEP